MNAANDRTNIPLNVEECAHSDSGLTRFRHHRCSPRQSRPGEREGSGHQSPRVQIGDEPFPVDAAESQWKR